MAHSRLTQPDKSISSHDLMSHTPEKSHGGAAIQRQNLPAAATCGCRIFLVSDLCAGDCYKGLEFCMLAEKLLRTFYDLRVDD